MRCLLGTLLRAEGGVTALEYGLIVPLVSLAAIVMFGLLGEALGDIFDLIAGSARDAADGAQQAGSAS